LIGRKRTAGSVLVQFGLARAVQIVDAAGGRAVVGVVAVDAQLFVAVLCRAAMVVLAEAAPLEDEQVALAFPDGTSRSRSRNASERVSPDQPSR